MGHDFMDLRARAELLELCGDHEGAARTRERSLEVAREVDLTCYAYQLMWRDHIDAAIELLEYTAAKHPESWNVHASLAEALESKGDVERALASYRAAADLVEDRNERARIEDAVSRLIGYERAVS